jgi:hypothetical protein
LRNIRQATTDEAATRIGELEDENTKAHACIKSLTEQLFSASTNITANEFTWNMTPNIEHTIEALTADLLGHTLHSTIRGIVARHLKDLEEENKKLREALNQAVNEFVPARSELYEEVQTLLTKPT